MQQEKLFKCLVSFQFLHRHKKINLLYMSSKKNCLGVFLKTSECSHLRMC